MRRYDQIWQWIVGKGSGVAFSMLLIMHCWHYVCFKIPLYIMMVTNGDVSYVVEVLEW